MNMKKGKYYTSLWVYRRWDETYSKLFKTKSRGMAEAINSFPLLRIHSIREMDNVFTKRELRALTEHFRHSIPEDPALRVNKENLISLIIDSSDWNNLGAKYNISYDDLIWKINNLTSAQVYFLQSEIARYWQMKRLGFTIKDFFTNFNL